jgi:putative addiction module component (TIGR02574 family)
MTEERKPPMSIQEIEAVLVDLPDEQLDDLLGRVMSQRTGTDDDIDPAVLAEAHRRLDEMKSGRVTPVPFEQLLDELETPTISELEAAASRISYDDRAALVDRLIVGLTGRNGYDPVWLAELNRRIDEVEAGTAKSVPAEEVFAKMKARRDAGSLPR